MRVQGMPYSKIVPSLVPATRDALVEAGRGVPSSVPTFMTEADSDDSASGFMGWKWE